jgi:hypothetical protein
MWKNRRVKALRLRWNRSSALFMPISSLSRLKVKWLKVWDKFNNIDWVEICRKYFVEKTQQWVNKTRGKTKTFQRIDNKTFPEHFSTVNYFRNKEVIWEENLITVTQKLHGTSWRFGHVLVRRQLNFVERLLKKCWIKINETEYDFIAWSRRVIKDKKAILQNTWYYKSDVWNWVLDRYKGLIPKDYILYGEVIWFIWNSPIQKWYTYNLKEWEFDMYVYRATVINQDWFVTELTADQVGLFCLQNWFKVVPELWRWKHKDFIAEDYLNITYNEKYSNAVPLCESSICDEWVVIRMESIEPIVLKAKSSDFLEFETKMIDKWVEDMEALEDNQN